MKKNFIPLFFGAAMAVLGAFQSQTAMADKKKPAADSTAVTTATSKTPEAHKPSKKRRSKANMPSSLKTKNTMRQRASLFPCTKPMVRYISNFL